MWVIFLLSDLGSIADITIFPLNDASEKIEKHKCLLYLLYIGHQKLTRHTGKTQSLLVFQLLAFKQQPTTNSNNGEA